MKIDPFRGPLSHLVYPLLVVALGLSGCKGSQDDEPRGMGGESGTGGGDGDGDGDSPTVIACDTDSECDDDLFCNGQEECRGGFCRQGQPVRCSDGIDCTLDRCDENTDECVSVAPDQDGDGHLDATCLNDEGEPFGDDCNDDDALSFPGNAEVCDRENRDEDCDPITIGVLDTDGDGYIDAKCCNPQEDGELLCGEDCDDRRANVSPQATEACDFLDNDCDGEVDEGVFIDMYPDKDHDGHGEESAEVVRTCPSAVGYATSQDDCDDSDPEVFKGQFEICDEKDNNCNGAVDEVHQQAPWYRDSDEDGFGDPESTPVFSCYPVPGRVLSQNDCDDGDEKINRNAGEICDGKDNDCNGLPDAPVGINDFEDDDGDGVADAACGGEDCDDTDARTSAGADEVCDRIDNDCDGEVDEQTVQNIWYIDEDGDGWGVVIGSALASCDPIAGRAPNFGDCDDTNREIHPGTTEVCDGVDQDCDGVIDEGAAVQCKATNAITACDDTECIIYSCTPGFVDTDSDIENGCEDDAPAPQPLGPCTTDNDCTNGNICDGFETCIEGQCYAGTPINCNASASVIQGDIQIRNGQDLQALQGVHTITGSVFVEGTNLTSLVGLEALRVIGGDLQVTNNPLLRRLSGSALSGLETVGGTILVENNSRLINVEMPSLLATTSLQIIGNAILESVGTFPNLIKVEQQIYIAQNPALLSIVGFEALRRVGGAYLLTGQEENCLRNWDYGEGFEAGGGIVIANNFLLDQIAAFSNVEELQGDLCIIDYAGDQPFFPELSRVGMSVRLEALLGLPEVELPLLEDVGMDFRVDHGNPEITEGTFPVMTKLALPELRSVGGAIDVYGDAGVLQAFEFPKLEEAGALQVALDNLTSDFVSWDLSALSSLGSVYMSVYGTPGLESWSFPELAEIENDGEFQFSLGDSQDEVRFPKLATAGGTFRLYTYNQVPLSLVDLADLVSVGGLDVSVATSDLDIGSLTTVSAQSFTLCTTASYADLCSDIAPFELDHTVETCGQCSP